MSNISQLISNYAKKEKQLLNQEILAPSIGKGKIFTTLNTGAIYSFKVPTKFFLNNIRTINSTEESPLAIKKVNSLYGSINLAYDNFLYLDVSTRNDWSSTLSEDNRSYMYNSASLSTLLNQFIDPSQKLFNLIKVRESVAQVGNDTDPYQINQTFSVPGNGYLGLTTLVSPIVKLNADLKSEIVTSSEFGLELSMLNNRLTLDVSVYDMTTEDLIFDIPVPAATGFQFSRENIGKVSNKGLEIALGVRLGIEATDAYLNHLP